MVQRVVKHRNQRERGERWSAYPFEHNRKTYACKENPDVFDGGVSQQALHIRLRSRKDDTIERSQQPNTERHQPPPPYWVPEQVKTNSQHSVHGDLEHDAAHESRNRRRCGRMRLGQPDMKRDQPGLGPKAEQSKHKRCRSPGRRQVGQSHCLKGELPASALHDTEAEQNRQRTNVRHQQVNEPRAADIRYPVICDYQEVGGERHGLPGDHERVGVVGQDH